MEASVVAEITSHFLALSSVIPLHAIRTVHDYEIAAAGLNQLLDAGAANEEHVLADLAHILGLLITEYENVDYPVQKISPLAMLRTLMDQNNLTQSNLPEIGTQDLVSEVLSGKLDLNVRQIKALSERFHVPPSAFV